MHKTSRFSQTLLASLLVPILMLGAQAAQAHDAKKVTGLKTPESVVEGKDGNIYVSEIGEFGKDGDGQISVIDKNGKLKVFATGMDDPKGLIFIGKDLYVADKTKVLKVAPDGKWQVFVPTEAFPVVPGFLNDLEADQLGNLYVSDSGDLKGKGGAIYRISPQGKVANVIDGVKDARILAPNGLLLDDTGHVLMVVDFASGILYSYNMQTSTLTKLAEGFGGGDGLVHHPSGIMYVSDWNNGKVYSVFHDEVTLIKDGFKASADIALTADGKYLLVPDMKAGELVYLPLHIKK
ncbi:MAG TPA: SMP-30/gluconolactonase/LRE family protein [Methylophilaceae bacterium]|nr:SMP-30/gluconolactonase/LRE family protein [Methylophilaceae bacterium]